MSVRERNAKSRMAFPVGPLARVGGGCMELDGPAIMSVGWLSVSAARDATDVSRARDVRKRDVGKNFCATFLDNYWEPRRNPDICALLGSRGLRRYPDFLTAPSSSREKSHKSRAAVWRHRVNNLALVVTVP